METVYIAGGCLWGVQHFFDKANSHWASSSASSLEMAVEKK